MLSKKDIEERGYRVIIPKERGLFPKVKVVHVQLNISRESDYTKNVNKNMNLAYQQMTRDLKEIEKQLKIKL